MKAHVNHLPRWWPKGLRHLGGCLSAALSGGARLSALLLQVAAGPLLASDTPSLNPWSATKSVTNLTMQDSATTSITATNAPGVGAISSMNLLDDKHVLAIGDQVSFRIIEDEADPKSLTVTDSGELEVPYVGRFQASGKTCKHLATQLKNELEKDYYYQATVIISVNVMTKSRGRVYLVGPVHTPGPQEIPSDEVLTLSKAILRAGGFTDFADQKNVKVTRQAKTPGGKDETFTINVGSVLHKGTTESDLPLEPGDLIYVPERLIHF